jgi:archaemetzincin
VTAVYQQKGLDYFRLVAETLKTFLDTDACDGGYFDIPAESYNPFRKQYNPVQIAKKITALNGKNSEFRFGIIDVDIYARGLNFIFGLAHPLRRIAIVSLYRLAGSKMHERLAKEVVHEMGHLLGLNHCRNANCVMYFSNTLDDTDKKANSPCAICRSRIEA